MASPLFRVLWPADPRVSRNLRRAAYALLGSLLIGLIVGVGVASVIRIPDVRSLAEFSPQLITTLEDRNGVSFQSYARQRRALLREGEIPPLVRDTILAAEDKNFYQHGGFDLGAAVRSLLIDLRLGRLATGASTITMQVARGQFDLTRQKLWRRKISETILAVELEKSFSKDQILTLYANMVNVGEGRYGFKEAGRYYFRKEIDELDVVEMATLLAIVRRPNDTPYSRPDVVEARRDRILDRMEDAGDLTPEEHAAAVARPLEAIVQRRVPSPGRYFSEDVRRHLIDTYGADSLYDRGLVVETTLDLDMQRAAEAAVRDGLSELDQRNGWRGPRYRIGADEDPVTVELPSWSPGPAEKGKWYEGVVVESTRESATVRIADRTYALDASGMRWTRRRAPSEILSVGDVAWFEVLGTDEDEEERLLLHQEPEMEAALLLVESRTGAIRALVGGWDYGRSEFNRATQARRQVGSAFKPFIFGAALEMGYTASDTLFDAPVVFRGADNLENYSPRNFTRTYHGILTLRRALEQSINVSTAKLLDMVGVDRVIDFAQRCGIESYLPPYSSLALGTAELTPLEIASSYTTLANQGVRVDPYMIERVSTQDGRVLEEHAVRPSEVVDPKISFLLTRVLEGVIARGTGASARYLDIESAGKTGTTDSFTDAWFVGYTPTYTLLVWVGYDQNRFLGRGMTGAVAALPIWRLMAEKGLEGGWIEQDDSFVAPPGLSTRRVEYRTGLLPGRKRQGVIDETFIAGTEPVQVYEGDWDRILSLPWYQQRPFYGIPKAGERMPEDVDDWSLVEESWTRKDGRL